MQTNIEINFHNNESKSSSSCRIERISLTIFSTPMKIFTMNYFYEWVNKISHFHLYNHTRITWLKPTIWAYSFHYSIRIANAMNCLIKLRISCGSLMLQRWDWVVQAPQSLPSGFCRRQWICRKKLMKIYAKKKR